MAGQTAAYEVVAGTESGPIVVEGAGKKTIALFVGEPADIPAITLTTPADGATLSGESVDVFWDITLKESDDHVHVYVDGEKKEGSVDYKNPYTLDFADKNIEPGQHVLEVRVSDKDHNEYTDPAASDSITFTLQAPTSVGDVLYRVNAGGPQLTASGDGPNWGMDTGNFGTASNSPYLVAHSTGSSTYNGNSGSAHPGEIDTSDASIPVGTPTAMFNTERYDPSSAPEMQWEFPVAAGTTVEVRLYFAELFSGVDAAGKRVFDVEVEGNIPATFNELDPFAIAGAKGAFMRSHTLTVTDGTLDIDFLHGVENPAIKGIEIIASDGTSNVPPQVGSIADVTSTEGDATSDYDISVAATDPDGPGNLEYSATGLPPGVEVEMTNGQLFGTIAAGAADNSPYDVTVSVSDGADTTSVNFTWTVTAETSGGNPSVTIKVTSNAGLFASTFGNNSFQISNTGDSDIERITIDSSSAFLPDIVFDPVGKAGDSGAKCLTAGTTGNTAAQVGLIYPANGGSDAADCVDPFDQPHNSTNDEEGYDKLDLIFTDGDGFNPGESFAFGVDMDPTSIKGDQSTGDAGSISGFELVGATVTVEFADGTLTSSLWEDGSLGGSQVVVQPGAPTAPSISVSGVSAPTTVTDANQTITISGPADATVALLRADARLYIDAGAPGGGTGHDVDPFEANEVLAKEVYTTTLDGSGSGSINVTLTQTSSLNAGPDAGINYFIAVVEGLGEQTSLTSNVIVLGYAPDDGGNSGGGTGSSGAFIEQNGLVVIEMESTSSLPGSWESATTYSASTSPDISNLGSATGGDFIVWQGGQFLGSPGNGSISYPVKINAPGTYRFQWRSQVGNGSSSTEHNDTWLKIEADSFYGQKNSGIVCPKGYTSAENDCTGSVPEGGGGGGWFKIYSSGTANWTWSTNTSDNDAHQIFARFDQAGVYNILISARSSSHVIDRMVLYNSSVSTSAATNINNPESPREQ